MQYRKRVSDVRVDRPAVIPTETLHMCDECWAEFEVDSKQGKTHFSGELKIMYEDSHPVGEECPNCGKQWLFKDETAKAA